jgi:hypothetical protein
VFELTALDRQEEHRPRSQVEWNRPVLLELAIDLERLREQLIDPRRRLTEEEAPVSPGGTGADSTGVDERDARSCLGEEARGGAAREACADDNGVRWRQDSAELSPRRFRQKSKAPRVAPTPAAAPAATAALRFLARAA